jgi:hypothetical protein
MSVKTTERGQLLISKEGESRFMHNGHDEMYAFFISKENKPNIYIINNENNGYFMK